MGLLLLHFNGFVEVRLNIVFLLQAGNISAFRQLINTPTIDTIRFQAALNHLGQRLRDVLSWNVDWLNNGRQQLVFIPAIAERSVAENELKDDDPEGPDISFWTILLFDYGFRAHVKRSAYEDVVLKLVQPKGREPEIGNLSLPGLAKKYIGSLEIPVDDSLLSQVLQP